MERRYSAMPGSGMRGLFTFALLLSFALLSLLIVLLGVRVYESIEARAALTHGSRTALMYLSGKIRAADPGSVRVEAHGDGAVLVIGNVHGDEAYNSYIYWREGKLCEYFGSASRAFDPAFGESVMEAGSFDVRWEAEGLLRVSVDAQTLSLYVMEGGGAQ